MLVVSVALVFFAYPYAAHAAISFVDSCANSAIDGGDVTLTLPSMQQNDLVIVSYAIGGFSADHNMAMVTSGYTEVADIYASDIHKLNLGVYWKVMGATPDTTAVVDGTGGESDPVAAVCMVFRGVDTATPMDVTPATATGIDSADPNPPSINHNNPSGVWTVIAGGSSHQNGTASYTFPTGYTTNARNVNADETGADGAAGMGYRSSGVTDPEDPAAMDLNAGSSDDGWGATTIALRPQTNSAPTVTTTAGASATRDTASVAGNITATGGVDPTTRGFAYGTSANLSSSVSTTTDSGSFSTGAFTAEITGLTAATTYYYRAYATNSEGTGYGSIETFTTSRVWTRMLRLFEGYKIKIIGGKLKINQQ